MKLSAKNTTEEFWKKFGEVLGQTGTPSKTGRATVLRCRQMFGVVTLGDSKRRKKRTGKNANDDTRNTSRKWPFPKKGHPGGPGGVPRIAKAFVVRIDIMTPKKEMSSRSRKNFDKVPSPVSSNLLGVESVQVADKSALQGPKIAEASPCVDERCGDIIYN